MVLCPRHFCSNHKSAQRVMPSCPARCITCHRVDASNIGPLCSPHSLSLLQLRKPKSFFPAEQRGFLLAKGGDGERKPPHLPWKNRDSPVVSLTNDGVAGFGRGFFLCVWLLMLTIFFKHCFLWVQKYLRFHFVLEEGNFPSCALNLLNGGVKGKLQRSKPKRWARKKKPSGLFLR